jgi:DNA (cytosine-5)-methyltransferase 1
VSNPRLLDLGCGGGGASMGYHRAGFEVTGVDIVHQKNYPFTFIQADALTFPLDGFDAIHASMPCQLWALATLGQRKAGKIYPDLITPLRPRLEASGVPWVMENVPGAPLRADMELCGCMFGLELDGMQLRRTRIFELSWRPEVKPVKHDHHGPAISIAGHGTPAWQRRLTGHVPVARWREVMGISWTTRDELTEAIPPVYTEHVGRELRKLM